MIIRGTKKIKGVLDLTGINKQLKAGDRLPITDNEFNDYTVQIAVNMGLLTYEEGNLIQAGDGSKSIKLRSIYDRPIRINALDADIRPQESFVMTEDQVNSADIRGALAKGLIEIVSSAKPIEGKEGTVKVGNLFDEEEEPIAHPVDPNDFLETNEELSAPKVVDEVEPTNIIDTEDPDPVKKSDLVDPKKKSIVWNPNKDPIAHTRTGMDAVSASKDNSKSDEANIDVGEISFVDEELDKERVEKHPILKNKPREIENDIDFL